MAEHGVRWRRWAEPLLAVAALFVSGISLWIGIRTEQANEKLVAASTWPYLTVESSNANPDGEKIIHMDVINSGVGPAKVESFELFWHGKAWSSPKALVQACCGYKLFDTAADLASKRASMLEGGIQGTVIRAGETRNFVTYLLTPDDVAVWHALNNARQNVTYRICYCSVFDECWVGNFEGILPLSDQLRPLRVKTCPVPKVPLLQ